MPCRGDLALARTRSRRVSREIGGTDTPGRKSFDPHRFEIASEIVCVAREVVVKVSLRANVSIGVIAHRLGSVGALRAYRIQARKLSNTIDQRIGKSARGTQW